MIRLTQAGFLSDTGDFSRFIELKAHSAINQAWLDRQAASVVEYLDHVETVPDEIETLYELFDGFISASLLGRLSQKVLDVGCGIRRDWPHYVRSLRKSIAHTQNCYVGLDPLCYDLEMREYPFVAGRLEDFPRFISDLFDVFIFSTSLDHFEDIELTVQSVKKLANSNAIAIFWVGMHDQTLVAEKIGASIISKLYSSLNPNRFIPRFLEVNIKLIANYFRLINRRRNMKLNKPLDKLHFHYFTINSIRETLSKFGEIVSYIQVPGTNSMFFCVRID